MTAPAPLKPHPGFGAFAKAHREFHFALDEAGWNAVPGYAGVADKVLSGAFDHQARRGAVTRLSRWQPGAAVTTPVSHEWCEEVFIISGSLSIGLADGMIREELLPAGTYAVRPAHVPHGPFFSRDGCLMIEFLYYPPDVS
ncbi:MAG: cupin [Alphaproteobacteria bacterium]